MNLAIWANVWDSMPYFDDWWADTTPLVLSKSFYMRGRSSWFIPWERAIDIDTPEDLELAKILLRCRE